MDIIIVPSHWDSKNYFQGRDSQPGLGLREDFPEGVFLPYISQQPAKTCGACSTGRVRFQQRLEMEIRRFKLKAGRGGGESPSSGLGGSGLPRIPTPASPRHLANKGSALLFSVLPAGSLLCAFTCASPSATSPPRPPGLRKPSHPP